jgi:hypothetical protein
MLPGDTLARMGGDEFTAVFTCFLDESEVHELLSGPSQLAPTIQALH